MSGNSTLLTQSFADPSHHSLFFHMLCLKSKPRSIIYATFSILRVLLLLPLCIHILHLGLQQGRKKRSASSASAMSHSDCFTHHLAIMELIDAMGYILCLTGIYKDDFNTFCWGMALGYFVWYGETHVNALTCVERYLAVVHPITYLSHRNKQGIRIRNRVCSCVWLSSLIGVSVMVLEGAEVIYALCFLTLVLITVTFCNISVLCTLIRPGPGERGGDREMVDPSRQRAFYTILAILVVLLIRFTYSLVWLVLYLKAGPDFCNVIVCNFLFNMPSSLVLPLLFLHRAGRLACCRLSGFTKE